MASVEDDLLSFIYSDNLWRMMITHNEEDDILWGNKTDVVLAAKFQLMDFTEKYLLDENATMTQQQSLKNIVLQDEKSGERGGGGCV
jgi:ABC-type uncharacterized transport system ATPase component